MAVVAARSAREPVEWLVRGLGLAASGEFATTFAAAGRKLGRAAIGVDAAAQVRSAGLHVSDTLGVDECARISLVLAAVATLPAGEQVGFVRDLIRRGEVRERQAVLRVLPALPEPARFVEIAIDACRTNVSTVFEAISCDNAYPSHWFPDPAFHQMVLKALISGAPVGRIVELERRITRELVTMVEAYASECRAAGRPVSTDATLIAR